MRRAETIFFVCRVVLTKSYFWVIIYSGTHTNEKGTVMANDLRQKQFERAVAQPNEFCVLCFRDMGFLKTLHVDHPYRYRGGANYNEGGQSCGDCNKK